MDNSQHYQPLSHALNPPVGAGPQQPPYASGSSFVPNPAAPGREEEEEEDDDDDEGLVEEQLNQNEQASPSPQTQTQPVNPPDGGIQIVQPHSEPKRRPGRPRGSKNKRSRAGVSQPSTTPQATTFAPPSHAIGTGTDPPQHPDINAQNQQYYEFQWRVLNLCAEFYGAAEELVKATPHLVVAQCYQMGPGVKVDPITMLNEAKRVCDTLLANPSRLVSAPPPPIYPVVPTFFQSPAPQSSPQTSQPPSASVSKANTAPATVITQPQTFVVPMGAQYPVYATPAAGAQYPTMSYYQYSPYGTTGGYYATSQPQASTSTSASASAPTSLMTGGGPNQGAWSEEEVERLRKLADECKGTGRTGDAAWDWVVQQWGNTRSRHQILIKATQLGLKESTTRGVKRRREGDAADDPPPVASTAPVANPNPSSTSHSENVTPSASPSISNRQQPTSSASAPVSTTPAPTTAANMPWPMPTVAATTPSPVIAAATVDSQRASGYYRPSSTPSSQTHSFVFQPNGRLGQNGK